MIWSPRRSLMAALALLLILLGGANPSLAQEDPLSGSVGIVATGLTNPRGMAWDDDGTLYVALAGSGGAIAAGAEGPTTTDTAPAGRTSAVARIDAGCPVPVAIGIPSVLHEDGGATGAADVAVLDSELYVLVATGGVALGMPASPTGLYRVDEDGSLTVIADHAAWLEEHPPASPPPEGFPNTGELYAMVVADGRFWVVDSMNGLVTSITPDGEIALVADLSEEHPVPTGIAIGPDGSLYVSTLTPAPYPDGAASVLQITEDGEVTEVWSGLTMVTDIAIGPDGALYALEMSIGNTGEAPHIVPGTGRLVRQTGPDTAETVADGLLFPVALAIGSDDGLYLSMPAIGADRGLGEIVRVDLSGEEVASTVGAPFCEPIPETVPAAPIPFGTPVG
jgi:sugar lactone lactonase YvrE